MTESQESLREIEDIEGSTTNIGKRTKINEREYGPTTVS